MTIEEERDYWRDLVKDMCDNMDNNAINLYKLKSIGKEIILKYSDHQRGCENNGNCNCGYSELIKQFYELK
jgi:hypothetical protein